MRQIKRTKEERLIHQLNSRNRIEHYRALRTISESGGPGAVPLLSKILKSKSTAKEKIRAAWAIRRIAYRTGIYYDGINLLENISNNDPSSLVRIIARCVRERIAGDCLITMCPSSNIDERILVSPKKKITPDFKC